MSKLVRIIIPHLNRVDHLANCLASIPLGVEVAVMRGGSFSYNVNAGAREGAFTRNDSRERYIVLNDDCVIPDQGMEFLQALVEGPGEVTACQIIPPDNTEYEVEKPPNGASFISGAYVAPVEGKPLLVYGVDKLPEHRPGEISIPAGCCFAINCEVFHAVGALNESFSNGYEDVDMFLRVLEGGYKFGWVPWKVVHFQGQSEGRYDRHHENKALLDEIWPYERLVKLIAEG